MSPRTPRYALALLLAACASPPAVPPIDSAVDVVRDASSPDVAVVPDADAAAAATLLVVRYPVPEGQTLSVRGSGAGLSWDTNVAMTREAADRWTLRLPTLSASLEWKPLLGASTWSIGPNYRAAAGSGSVEVYPRFLTQNGQWSRRYTAFHSALLGNDRGVWVYLPPSYDENTAARFPVVYMHDGQNLFDPAASFGGVSWQVQDAMNAGAADGTVREALVVGPENNADRIAEYTPVADPDYPGSGNGALYLRFLTEELKPEIDRSFRTLSDRENTALVGSSLGGLISVYGGAHDAGTYGLIGALSPSTWWDNTELLREVPALATLAVRPTRFYVDSGDSGTSNDDVDNTRMLAAGLRTAGYRDEVSLRYLVQQGASHSETYWSQRIPGALAFLLGPRP